MQVEAQTLAATSAKACCLLRLASRDADALQAWQGPSMDRLALQLAAPEPLSSPAACPEVSQTPPTGCRALCVSAAEGWVLEMYSVCGLPCNIETCIKVRA